MSSDTEWCLAELVQLVGVGAKGCQAVELVCVPVREQPLLLSVWVFVYVRTDTIAFSRSLYLYEHTAIIAFSW